MNPNRKIKKDNLILLGAYSGLIAVVFDLLLIALFSFSVPNYDQLSQYISELPLQTKWTHLVFSLWWSFFTPLMLFFSYGLFLHLPKNRWNKIAIALIASNGVLIGVLVAVFPCDTACNALTFSGRMHNIVSGFAYIIDTFLPTLLILGLKNESGWKRTINFLFQIQVIYLLCLFFTAVIEIQSWSGIDFFYTGLFQRITTTFFHLLTIYFAVHMLKTGLKK